MSRKTKPHTAQFRFYEELNDFLPQEKRKVAFPYPFDGSPSVKDAIEAIGVPHTEVDLIVVNGESVGFDYHLADSDRVAVYPVFESLDISPVNRLRPEPLRDVRFIADGHLGKLAKYLRMLGFDTHWDTSLDDHEIVRTALAEGRIILTRDRGLLKHGEVTHGTLIRSARPLEQIAQVIHRFNLTGSVKPFHRCIVCNGDIAEVSKDTVIRGLKTGTVRHYNRFYRCVSCGKVYWRGSHFKRMAELVERLTGIRLANGVPGRRDAPGSIPDGRS